LVRRPQVFLMDEPLSNLDAKTRVQTRAELSELHATLGATFIYVTHDQVEAMTMGTRIAVIDQGRLQQVGTPDEVYERPANMFVAGFIGSPPMNIVLADAVAHDGTTRLSIGTGSFTLPEATATAVVANGTERVAVGIRPEHLRLDPDGPIEADVRAVESLGHERHIVCELLGTDPRPDDLVPGDLVIARQSSEDAAPRQGDRIRLGAHERHLHLFDPERGDRLELGDMSTSGRAGTAGPVDTRTTT
ncbi:MAG: TOBE domain-containing protein, partial [Ilumatobacteraceae bacterium]